MDLGLLLDTRLCFNLTRFFLRISFTRKTELQNTRKSPPKTLKKKRKTQCLCKNQGTATIWWWYHELVPIVVPIQNSIFGVFMQNKKKNGWLLIQRQTNPFLTGQFVENVEKNYFQRVKSRCWRFSKFQTRNFINFGKSAIFSLFHS